MKRVLVCLLTLFLVFQLAACGEADPDKKGSAETDRAAANITAGAAKAAQSGKYIYLSRGDRIVKFDPDEIKMGDSLDDFTFKSSSYADICVFAGKLYAIRMPSDDRAEIVAIDQKTGDEKVVKAYEDEDARNLWFCNLIGDKLYLWVNGGVYTLDKNDKIKDTGYRDPLFVTEDGAYLRASVVDGVNRGLTFVSNGKATEYPDLLDSKVDIMFRYGSRIYLSVDNKPAYIEHKGSKKVNYINVSSVDPDLVGAYTLFMNYVDSPKKTLVLTVGYVDPDAPDLESTMYSFTYTVDIETWKATQIHKKQHCVVPLCWPSVIGDEIFVGGINDSTDWITDKSNIL